jgi:tetratricopeptide (TPR) repeat protein
MEANYAEPYFFMEGGRVFDALHDKQQAYNAFRHAIDVAADNAWFYTEAGRWFRDNGYVDEAYLVFKKALSFDNSDPAILEDLASVLAMRGQNSEAVKLRNDAAAIRGRKGYQPATHVNYNEIVRRVLDHGAVMVAMQYPLRDVRPLRDMLRDREKVIFVENRTNFQKVLQNGEDSRYFADYFASDFGHCKAAGNLLIAKSLADVLEKKVLPNL